MEENRNNPQDKKRKAIEIILIILACILPTLLFSGCGCIKGIACKVCSCVHVII